jgi:predicted amidohydrolase
MGPAMPRKVRVLTTSFHGPQDRSIAGNRELACSYVDAAGAEGADLVCLPESLLDVGLPKAEMPVAEPLDGPTIQALAALARKHELWVVAPICVRSDAGTVDNSAVVIDRRGGLAGVYSKVHPTIGECRDRGITPGVEATVVDTDFGRVGLAICYDIGWPDHWQRLREAGAELVVWPSAYDGGFPLQAYAWLHSYFVVSSVRTEHGKVIDITGRVLASTSRWHRLAAATIDLEKEMFHIDDQVAKLFEVQRDFGRRVTVEALTEEHVFTLESNDPDWPVRRIVERYGLENFRDYHDRAAGVQHAHRLVATPSSAAVAG